MTSDYRMNGKRDGKESCILLTLDGDDKLWDDWQYL